MAKPVKFDFVGITTFTGFGIHIYMTTRFRQTSDFLEPERRELSIVGVVTKSLSVRY